ncbi:MAG: MFS transporter [Pseudomonadota bacterium]
MIQFLAQNRRWLGAGLLLTFASGFGQTWFISLFAGDIKAEHDLTDGGWGAVYTAATLGSAALVFWRGSLADQVPFHRLAPAIAMLYACAAIAFAFSTSIWLLGLAVLGLRFCGQGMFSHLAMTAMGRWFTARRGQAVAIASLGYPLGEVVLPLLAVSLIALFGWQLTWVLAAAIIAIPVALALRFLLSETRTGQTAAVAGETPGIEGRHWARSDALRHWLLPALLPILLTPGFIGTVIFFHQVHVSDVKGWTMLSMTPGYTLYAGFAVALSFASGWASDRYGPQYLLPFLLVPMGFGIAFLSPASEVWGWYLCLALIGISQGISNALLGLLFPAIYGTKHLGAIRSMAITILVFSTAIGPGLTGLLIDYGIDFPAQGPAMGMWCLAMSALGFLIMRKLSSELSPRSSVA